jgi:hypothetical protein
MNTAMIARVLWQRRALRRHEQWTTDELHAHQERGLADLRTFAARRSLFYQRFHAGLDRAPLSELPVLTKALLMEHFDELATDPSIHLAEIQKYLDTLHDDRRFAGRYWVSATSGSAATPPQMPS